MPNTVRVSRPEPRSRGSMPVWGLRAPIGCLQQAPRDRPTGRFGVTGQQLSWEPPDVPRGREHGSRAQRGCPPHGLTSHPRPAPTRVLGLEDEELAKNGRRGTNFPGSWKLSGKFMESWKVSRNGRFRGVQTAFWKSFLETFRKVWKVAMYGPFWLVGNFPLRMESSTVKSQKVLI